MYTGSSVLIMKTVDGSERPFPITKPRMVIGRDTRSDLRISVPSVANEHCELIFREDTLRFRDLGSETGTLHNGRPAESATLNDSDTITIGPVTFEVRYGQAADTAFTDQRSPEET